MSSPKNVLHVIIVNALLIAIFLGNMIRHLKFLISLQILLIHVVLYGRGGWGVVSRLLQKSTIKIILIQI